MSRGKSGIKRINLCYTTTVLQKNIHWGFLVLTIRAAQMRVFEDDQLHRWIAQFLWSCYPDRMTSPGAVHHHVTRSIERARTRGLSAAFEIKKYVHIAFLADWMLESSPDFRWARLILDDEELGGLGGRVHQVEAQLAGGTIS